MLIVPAKRSLPLKLESQDLKPNNLIRSDIDMDDYQEITDENYIINDNSRFKLFSNEWQQFMGHAGRTLKQLKNQYPAIVVTDISKSIKPRFECKKPYPFGY